MPDWDAATWTAVGAIITGVLSLFFTKGAQAVIMLWEHKQKMRERALQTTILEDENLEDSLKWTIRKQDRRITQLEKETKVLQVESSRCHEEKARLEERMAALEEKHRGLTKILETYDTLDKDLGPP